VHEVFDNETLYASLRYCDDEKHQHQGDNCEHLHFRSTCDEGTLEMTQIVLDGSSLTDNVRADRVVRTCSLIDGASIEEPERKRGSETTTWDGPQSSTAEVNYN